MDTVEPPVPAVSVACSNLLFADVLATALLAHGIEVQPCPAAGDVATPAAVVIDPVTCREHTVRDLVKIVRGLATAVGSPAGHQVAPARGDRLITPREQQILELVAAGRPDEGVAAMLGISVRTVRAHLQSIRVKLGARNRFAAVAGARAAGLLPRPGVDPVRPVAGGD